MAGARDLTLVTGASGFVGSAVARALVARGDRVRVLVRATSPRRNLEDLGAEIVQGDMRDPADARRAAEGARHVFHVAADYRLWARDPEEIVRNNLAGTNAVMQAALAAGVERVVYTSSVATLSLDKIPADETQPLTPEGAIGAYKRSKTAAERLVERMIAEQGLPAVIVNPSTPIGPRDVRPTPTGRITVEAATGRIPAFVDTGLNLVHVDDVAAGHLLALEKGRIGERYILGGQDVLLRDMLAEIARQVGRKPPTMALPRAPLYPLAAAAELWAQVTGKEPFLTRDALKMSSHRMFFTSAKAERELGYRARPWEQAVAVALAMTPLADALGRFSQQVGAALTAYDRKGRPLATTVAYQPQAVDPDAAQTLFAGGATVTRYLHGSEREMLGRLVLDHRPVAVLGTALDDNSEATGRAVFLYAAIGLLCVMLIVGSFSLRLANRWWR